MRKAEAHQAATLSCCIAHQHFVTYNPPYYDISKVYLSPRKVSNSQNSIGWHGLISNKMLVCVGPTVKARASEPPGHKNHSLKKPKI
jgi:hypothetical protein